MDIDDIQQVLSLFLKHSDVAVAIKDNDGRYLFANREFGRYADAPLEDITGHCDHDFLAPERTQALNAAAQSAIASGSAVSCEEHFSRAGFNVAYLSTRFPILDEHHRMTALGLIAMELTARQGNPGDAERALRVSEQLNIQLSRAIETLETHASTDRLTHAWNRRRFEEAVEVEIDRSKRYGHPLSLILLDIDHFKRINDNHGHQEGDRVLRDIADRLRETMRKPDSLTRWGGEEFIILMPDTDLQHARLLAERIRHSLAARPIKGVGTVTASIGVAEYMPVASLEEWLARADRAMYTAKREGRNRIETDATHPGPQPSAEHLEGGCVQLA
jgi:diguanylate cyclase (GGDEF)-like protein